MDQKTQDKAGKDPRWVPAISSATSAPRSARMSERTHPAEAARVIFRFGLLAGSPARWTRPFTDPRAKAFDQTQWKDGHLTLEGMEPLALPALASVAHTRRFVTAAMAHGFSRWAWSNAEFLIDGIYYSGDIDALAIRRGEGSFGRLNRVNVAFSPTDNNRIGTTYASMCGTTVRVEIEKATGALRIAKAYSVFECGQALVPEVVMGQAQGGSPWVSATHCRRLCRRSRVALATGNGIAASISVARGSICRSVTSRSKCCHR